MKVKIFYFFLTLFLFTCCAVGPDYHKPNVAIPEKFKEIHQEWKEATPQDTVEKGKWWKIFQDQDLNELEDKLNIENQTIAQAQAQHEEAQSIFSQAQANYFPTISALGSYSRARTPGTNSPTVVPPKVSNNISTSLQASWELDLWGVIRRTVEAGKAGEQASGANLEAIKLSQQSLLAQNYFLLRVADKNQQLLDEIVEKNEKNLELIEEMFHHGIISLSEVFQAKNQLSLSLSQSSENKIIRQTLEHAIAVSVGESPSLFTLDPKISNVILPRLPNAIPSSLLERRPDVAQAERLMAQANAQIGVAQGGYFPTLSLNASGGYQSNALSSLTSAPSLFWSLGTSLTSSLFNGGLTGAKVDYAKASYQASVANYRQVVLNAFQNVEDNFVSLNNLKDELQYQEEICQDSQQNQQVMESRYHAGIVNQTAILSAQTSTLITQKQWNDLKGRYLVSTVNLFKALGGGVEEK